MKRILTNTALLSISTVTAFVQTLFFQLTFIEYLPCARHRPGSLTPVTTVPNTLVCLQSLQFPLHKAQGYRPHLNHCVSHPDHCSSLPIGLLTPSLQLCNRVSKKHSEGPCENLIQITSLLCSKPSRDSHLIRESTQLPTTLYRPCGI